VMSTATTAAPALASVFTAPNGSGNAINNCMTLGVSNVDATITLTVLDIYGTPVVAYPREDMWLETSLLGLLPCTDGTIADADTDVSGQTTFSAAVYAGGGSAYVPPTVSETTIVVIDGTPLAQPGLEILFNSGDLSMDRIIGVQDTALFKPLYVDATTNGTYYYEIDYYFDGAVTLSDLVLFAGTMNTTCP